MIKIGIITYHCAYNYGAILQAYALQTKLVSLGYETEFIDFKPAVIVDGYKEDILSNGKRAIFYKIVKTKEFFQAQNIRKLRYAAFDDFTANFINISSETYKSSAELDVAEFKYDVFVCGSDQIWNSNLNGNERSYFLSFAKKDSRKVAYAPSFAVDEISEAECQSIKPLLSSFTALSAREEQGIKILNDQLQLAGTHVLDPTLLLEAKQWIEMSSSHTPLFNSKYIFVYIIGDSKKAMERIGQFRDREDLDLIFVGIGPLLQPNLKSYIDMSEVGPIAFMNLLINAEYVCTNSFHGMTLSILFNKKFTVIFNHNMNSRMESLLKMCGLEKQKYNTDRSLHKKDFEQTNFDYANNIIIEQSLKSERYLVDAIGHDNSCVVPN